MFRTSDKKPTAGPRREDDAVSFSVVPRWLINVLGMKVQRVPSFLRYPKVQPVIDIYRAPLYVFTYPAPGSNATATVTLPKVDGTEWLLEALTFRFTTSAAAANRIIRVTDLTSSYRTLGNFTQVASVTADYAFAPAGVLGQTSSIGGAGGVNAILMPCPNNETIPGGGSLLIEVTAADVGDVLSAIVVTAWQRASGGLFNVSQGLATP